MKEETVNGGVEPSAEDEETLFVHNIKEGDLEK